jgi:uncharacterized membrane protein YeaQ/YmgE (transglycosylase-associated protein family)
MSLELLLVWSAVGMVAGGVAAAVGGTRSRAVTDLVVGVGGAVLAGVTFLILGIQLPLRGIVGTVCVASLGAAFLLFVARAVRGARI